MRREDFEHVIRAAADVTDDEIVVVGSQAVLAQYPEAQDPLTSSLEADVFPRHHQDRADKIDGAIGDGSPFHEINGYYAHAVGPETVIAPAGWESRLIKVEVPAELLSGKTATAWALEIHDLVLSKLAAGRPRDVEFAKEAILADMADPGRLERGVDLMPSTHKEDTRERLNGLLKQLSRSD